VSPSVGLAVHRVMTDVSPLSDEQLAALDRYVAGHCSADEQHRVTAWLDATPVVRDRVEALVKALPKLTEAAPRSTDSWNDFQTHLHRPAPSAPRVVRSSRPGRHWGVWASGFAVMLAVTAGILTLREPSGRSSVTPNQATHYVTAPGQRAHVMLPDGSRAILGPATKLTLASRKSSTDQGMTFVVDGEVLFTVTPNMRAPFVVHTSNSVARVLGTTFVVRHYATDRQASIVVVDGRVALAARDASGRTLRERVLDARMRGVVHDSGTMDVTSAVSTAKYTTWADGRLVFESVPARDVIVELERAYDVDVQIADTTIAGRRLTWSVSTKSSLTDVLAELGDMLDRRVVRKGRHVIIELGKSPSSQTRERRPTLRSLSPESQYGR
jgi:transmembrane sensor